MFTKPTENHRYTKQKRVFNEQYQEDDIVVVHSKRAGIISSEDLNEVTVSQVFHEIQKRDNFGLVVLYVENTGLHARIQQYSNHQYEVLVFDGNNFSHKNFVAGYTNLNAVLFDSV